MLDNDDYLYYSNHKKSLNNTDFETVHLEVLSHISRELMHQEVRDKLMAAVSYKEVLAAF